MFEEKKKFYPVVIWCPGFSQHLIWTIRDYMLDRLLGLICIACMACTHAWYACTILVLSLFGFALHDMIPMPVRIGIGSNSLRRSTHNMYT